ncbi:MAG TPA: tetratricopeptide repeat protein, partial [Pirellulales bacterium]
MPPDDETLSRALAHHQSGRLAEAEQLYRAILTVDPNHAGALHLLGVLAMQSGRPADATALIRQAIARNPAESIFHSNLGEACRALGQIDEAIANFRRAIELAPNFPAAH